MTRTVSVIGGGPGGLFAARLLALRHPDWTITLYERLDPAGTFGFGVGLTGAALDAVAAVDPTTREAIETGAARFASAEFRLPSGPVQLPGFSRGVSIGRATLLQILVDQASSAGVRTVIGVSADVDDVIASSDVVIAADGVSSASRQRYADVFEPEITEGRLQYLWCGSSNDLPGGIFQPVETAAGVFTTHCYPYADGRSAYVFEAEPECVEAAGYGGPMDIDASDERALAELSAAFTDLLDGNPLVGNRSQWFRFRTVRCARWTHRNLVLLGDAAATADPSLGSGTKLAMESAIALADAFDDESQSVEESLAAYEQRRRPSVQTLQRFATRSQGWWDTFPRRLDLEPNRLAIAFLSRAGALTLDDALASNKDITRAAAAAWAGVALDQVPTVDLSAWVVATPLAATDLVAGSRVLDAVQLADAAGDATIVNLDVAFEDPWGPDADRLVATAERARADGAPAVVLRGGTDDNALVDRLQVSERLRMEAGVTTGIAASPTDDSRVAAGLVAGRIDFAVIDQ